MQHYNSKIFVPNVLIIAFCNKSSSSFGVIEREALEWLEDDENTLASYRKFEVLAESK